MDATLSFYMDGLYGYAMVLTGDATVAADLVQETYGKGVSVCHPAEHWAETSTAAADHTQVTRGREYRGPRHRHRQRFSRALCEQSGSRASARSDHAASSGVPRDHSAAGVCGAFVSGDRHLVGLPAWDRHVTHGNSTLQTPNLTFCYRPFIAAPSKSAVALCIKTGRERWRYLGMTF